MATKPFRPLSFLAGLAIAFPKTTLSLSLMAALLGGLAGSGLTLKTSNLDLIDPDHPVVADFLKFTESFGNPNSLVLVLEGPDPDGLRQLVDQIEPQLAHLPGVRTSIARLPFDQDTLWSLGLDPYFTSDEEDLFFIFIQPQDERTSVAAIEPLIQGVRKLIDGLDFDRDTQHIGMTGIPKYALDDRDIITGDIARLSGISLILGALILWIGLRRPAWIFPVLGTILISLAITAGIASLTVGHLSLLSALFASILFGLGVDYGIHIVHRLETQATQPRDWDQTLSETFAHLEKPLRHAAMTSAVVFYLLLVSGFRGFAELGFLAGTSLLVCLLCMYTTLPACLSWLGPQQPLPAKSSGTHFLGKSHPWLAVLGILIPVSSIATGLPTFDSDYRNLHPRNSEAVRLETLMVDQSDFSPHFLAFTCPDRQTAETLVERLSDHPEVGAVRSLTDFEDLRDPQGNPLQIPASLQDMFRDNQGRYAVLAYPKGAIWQNPEKDRFLSAMLAIGKGVTGMPLLAEVMIGQSRKALFQSGLLALVTLFLIGWWDFGNARHALLILVPPLYAVALMAAFLRWTGIGFNPIDVMAIPIILGIAVDDSAHIVYHHLRNGGQWAKTYAACGKPVLLTTLTTLAAFGALAFGQHRGLRSFCLALCVGVFGAWFASTIIQPFLLPLLCRTKATVVTTAPLGAKIE